MTTQYIYNLVDTWASGGGPYTSIKMNATDNDSGSASLLMDLQVGGAAQFRVAKNGLISAGAGSLMPFGGDPGQAASWYVHTNTSFGYRAGERMWTNAPIHFNGGTNIVGDLILSRRAAANLRLGAADAAAPVAQTLSVQSVVAGTTNTAGTNLTITGSQGTGTGAGGSIIFQVAPAGSTGTAQNALATALTIVPGASGDRHVVLAGTASTNYQGLGAPAVYFGGGTAVLNDPNQYATGQLRGYNSGTCFFVTNTAGVTVASDIGYRFSSTTNAAGTADLILLRDAANTLALRNGTAAQAFNVYNTYTDASNYERGRIQWNGNELRIGTGAAGTGSLRSVGIYSGNTRYQIIGSSFNQFDQSVYMNGANIATDTSTGFKIGTGATQKIGFWNATPIAQPTTAVAAATVAATGVGDVVAASTTFDGYTIPQIVKAMRNAGLLA